MRSRTILFLLLLLFFLPAFSHAQYAGLNITVAPRQDYKKHWKTYDLTINIYPHGKGRFVPALAYSYLESSTKSCVSDTLNAGLVDIVIKGNSQPDTTIEGVLLQSGTTKEVYLHYPPYCAYEARRSNKTCPRCHKKDKVLPIHYGEPLSTDPHSLWNRSHYLGGCRTTGCDPNWFCQRDQLKF